MDVVDRMTSLPVHARHTYRPRCQLPATYSNSHSKVKYRGTYIARSYGLNWKEIAVLNYLTNTILAMCRINFAGRLVDCTSRVDENIMLYWIFHGGSGRGVAYQIGNIERHFFRRQCAQQTPTDDIDWWGSDTAVRRIASFACSCDIATLWSSFLACLDNERSDGRSNRQLECLSHGQSQAGSVEFSE